MYKALLFDLDGTLTESGIGITRCVQYALEKIGKPEPDADKLLCFVGPPLKEQFMTYADVNEETAQQAVQYYRERYSATGIYENLPYPGIEDVLEQLQKDYTLAVASSKPEEFVNRVLDYFHLTSYFDVIVGAEMNGPRRLKCDVVEEALRQLHLEDKREQVLMIGDKEHDVLGARAAGVQCLAVAYGYGTREELEAAKPLAIADTVEDILHFFE